jgi:hypothetical protein
MQPGPQAGEIVHRPDPGLARGKWEAPSWAFLAVAAVAVVLTLLYALVRSGKLRLTRRTTAANTAAPAKRDRAP